MNHVARSGTPRVLSFQIVEFCPKHFAIFLPLKVANIPEFLMVQKKRFEVGWIAGLFSAWTKVKFLFLDSRIQLI